MNGDLLQAKSNLALKRLAAVGLIALDKYLPGQGPTEIGSDAGQNLSVAR